MDIKNDFEYAKREIPKVIKVSPEINKVDIVMTNSKKTYYNIKGNIIYFGTKDLHIIPNKIIRQIIVHEVLHAAGYDHKLEGHRIGYYSKIMLDKFSRKVMDMIGWSSPTSKDLDDYAKLYIKEYRKELESDAKYIIQCLSCGYKVYKKRKSKFTENIDRVRCPKCFSKVKLIVRK